MKELHFSYSMKLLFEPPVSRHRFTLKCFPASDERQTIEDLRAEIYPKEFLSADKDSFGNSCLYGYAEGTHDHFMACVTGTARTGLSDSLPAGRDWEIGLFKYQTDYTRPGPAVRTFAERFSFPEGTSAFDRAVGYMHGLYENFSYVQGVTDIHTTAEEAMAQGQGVCQDYSHILLSLCRLERIPCRYVVGMLTGEGFSHAWTEVCSGGRWYALDPTNNLIVADQHIKISCGRDYHDCIVNQGVFCGVTRQTQEILVKVEKITNRQKV